MDILKKQRIFSVWTKSNLQPTGNYDYGGGQRQCRLFGPICV